MNKQIVRLIADLAAAERVREELLAAGLASDSIELTPPGDEAGPPQANFTVGDSAAVKGGTDYKDVYAPGEQNRGPCVILVALADAAQEQRVNAILDRHGATGMDIARQRGLH